MESAAESNREQKAKGESTIRNRSKSIIDHLPREVMIDVLSRLPITSLLQYRSTSHGSHSLTSDPKLPIMFQNQAKNRSPALLFLCTSGDSNELYFGDADHDESHSITARKLSTTFPEFDLVGSCNGLLCISHAEVTDSAETTYLHVYNPLVGEVMRLQKPNKYTNQTEVYGFGFVSKTNEYKVVRIVHHIIVERRAINQERGIMSATYLSEIEVLTLGTDQAWRNKGQSQRRYESPDRSLASNQAFVAESVHWLGCFYRRFGPRAIIAFDMGTETLQEIPNPEFERQDAPDCRLCEINGCLSLATYCENGQVDIWVMKQYKVKDSWTKEFSIGPSVGDIGSSSGARFGRVMCGMRNGQILVKYENRSLVLYDPVADMFQVLQVNGLQDEFRAFPFVPSLLPVKAALELHY